MSLCGGHAVQSMQSKACVVTVPLHMITTRHCTAQREPADVQREMIRLTWSNDRAGSACGHGLGICASYCKGSRCSCLGSCTSTRHIKASTARLAKKANNLACLEPLPCLPQDQHSCSIQAGNCVLRSCNNASYDTCMCQIGGPLSLYF